MPNWYVYGLIDPRDFSVFYIGISTNVKNRLANHHSDCASSAWHKCKEIKEAGLKAAHCVFAILPDKLSAKLLERALVKALPVLENSRNPKGMASEGLYPLAAE